MFIHLFSECGGQTRKKELRNSDRVMMTINEIVEVSATISIALRAITQYKIELISNGERKHDLRFQVSTNLEAKFH